MLCKFSFVLLLISCGAIHSAETLKESQAANTANARLSIVCRGLIDAHCGKYIDQAFDNKVIASAAARVIQALLNPENEVDRKRAAKILTPIMEIVNQRGRQSHPRNDVANNKEAFLKNRIVPENLFPDVAKLLACADAIAKNPSIEPDLELVSEVHRDLISELKK